MADWHFLENQFLNVTTGNRKRMNIMTHDHKSRLAAQSTDVDIADLLTRYIPVHDDFVNAYGGWNLARANHISKTSVVTKMRNDLSGTLIRQWDSAIIGQHDIVTEEYKALMPNRREPFQTGGIDERISAVKVLRDQLVNYPTLAALQTTVADFYGTFNGAREQQQEKEQLVADASTTAETGRIAVGTLMYGNLGIFMNK